jgi:hypothetical protein
MMKRTCVWFIPGKFAVTCIYPRKVLTATFVYSKLAEILKHLKVDICSALHFEHPSYNEE